MHFYIESAIFETFPDLKVGLLVVKGADNHRTTNQEIEEMLAFESKNLQEKYQNELVSDIPKIGDWRRAYKAFGYQPSSYRSSLEALLRRLIRDGQLTDINPIVNFCNLISLKHALPVSGDDLDQVSGSIRLDFAKGGEFFVTLGSKKLEQARPGEVVYRDDLDLLSKAWNYRKSDKSQISEVSQNVALVLEGLESTSFLELREAAKELQTLVETYCGGKTDLYLLDRECSHLGLEAEISRRRISLKVSVPDYHTHETFKTRTRKLKEIREMGVDPYPHKYTPSHQIKQLLDQFDGEEVKGAEEALKGETDQVAIAGRLILFRPMGKNAFAHLQDGNSRIQVMFNRDHTRVEGLSEKSSLTPLKFIEKKIDLGDIIGVKGNLFRTQKGELTVYATKVTLLSKALLPLPDKHSGLVDKGTRYRKRWLDLITNEEALERLKTRSFLVSHIRKYFENADFIEVETPVLQNIYGGAEARPFVSKLNALHQTMYLRIAIEISLKKLIVGGMPRVFEIGKVYRNEGIDRTHNPEFTMMEAYASYWDYNDVMVFVENLFAYLAKQLCGSTNIGKRRDKWGNMHEIDLKTPWKRLSMKEAICTYGGFDPDEMTDLDMRDALKGKVKKTDLEKAPRGKLLSYLFEEFAEEHLIDPHHIIDHPIETTPLCKLHRDPKLREEQLVERFETFMLGYEFCNAYSELNDPELQRKLLEEQNLKREGGDVEANPMDEEFIEAICQGMPPTGGFGIGIDRLAMLFTDAFSIRDVIYFPMMRPEE